MSTSKECKAVRNCILNELHLTKEDIIKNIEPLLEKHVKRYMVNTYGGDNLDCVNFIEMTEGYLNKTCTFVSN